MKREEDPRAKTTSLAQGEVVSGKTALTLAEVGSRYIELRVTGGRKPIEKVGCFIDQAGVSLVSSGMLFFTNKDGVAKGFAFQVPSRVQCIAAPGGWNTQAPHRRRDHADHDRARARARVATR